MKAADSAKQRLHYQGKYKEAALNSRNAKLAEVRRREAQILNSGNPNLFWKYVNKKMACKNNIPALKIENGDIRTDSTEKCSTFNKYFSSTFQYDNGCLPKVCPLTDNSLCFVDFPPRSSLFTSKTTSK